MAVKEFRRRYIERVLEKDGRVEIKMPKIRSGGYDSNVIPRYQRNSPRFKIQNLNFKIQDSKLYRKNSLRGLIGGH